MERKLESRKGGLGIKLIVFLSRNVMIHNLSVPKVRYFVFLRRSIILAVFALLLIGSIASFLKIRTELRSPTAKLNVPLKERPYETKHVRTSRTEVAKSGESQAMSTSSGGKSYQELLDQFESAQNSTLGELERRHTMCRIVENMVIVGHYADAKNLVTNFGDGILRNALIHSLFSKNHENLDVLVTRVKESGFTENDQLSIWTGIMQNLSGSDGPSRVAALLASNNTLGSEETDFLMQGAIHYINPGILGALYWSDPSDSSTWPDETESARRIAEVESLFAGLLAKNPELRDSFYTSLITELLGPMTSESLEIFFANYQYLKPETRGGLGGEVLSSMFAKSPSETLNAIESFGSNPDLPQMLAYGIKGWLRNDSNAVETWLGVHGHELGKESYDRSIKTLAAFLADKNRIEDASAWVAKIADPSLRSQAEGEVWSRERELLRQSVGQDPSGTVQDIVAGRSKYGDYWIEEAMSTWIAKDFDKAQDWYQKNWNSMPANKSQYLAAAFAKQAASQGEVATAREWAAHIQDAKTKQRIEAGIAKAVEQQGN